MLNGDTFSPATTEMCCCLLIQCLLADAPSLALLCRMYKSRLVSQAKQRGEDLAGAVEVKVKANKTAGSALQAVDIIVSCHGLIAHMASTAFCNWNTPVSPAKCL